uniref:Uncharacterized protein n=1 Tax=Anguilla anguilla TaxID=7936 RepID=A0A0E9WKP7_ANGAN
MVLQKRASTDWEKTGNLWACYLVDLMYSSSTVTSGTLPAMGQGHLDATAGDLKSYSVKFGS